MDQGGASLRRGRTRAMIRALLPSGLALGVFGLLAVAALPASAQDPIGDVGGTPQQLARFQMVLFELGQFGDVAILCQAGGCQTSSGSVYVQYDTAVWADINLDAGDAFANEQNTTVRHTFAGSVLGTTRFDTSTADIVCFSVPATGGSERRCIKVVAGSATGPAITNLTVRKDTTDASFCTALANKTVGVTATAPPAIAYVVSLDTDPSNDPGGQTQGVEITVCDGFTWQAANPAAFGENDVMVTGQLLLDVVRTPGLLLTKCRCY